MQKKNTPGGQLSLTTKTREQSEKRSGFVAAGSLFTQFALEDKGGYITQEFQDFGYRIAVALNDLKHKSLYIKMAKQLPRVLLERALTFVADAQQAKSKARLFMWKVDQLQKEAKQPAPVGAK